MIEWAFMRKATSSGVVLLLPTYGIAASDRLDGAIATAPHDAADIQRVMDSFRQAVAAQDGEGISALFLDHGSTWFTVRSDRVLAAAKPKKHRRENNQRRQLPGLCDLRIDH